MFLWGDTSDYSDENEMEECRLNRPEWPTFTEYLKKRKQAKAEGRSLSASDFFNERTHKKA